MFKSFAAACMLASAVSANAQSTPATPADCLFDWAETNYPNLFSPAGAPSGTFGQYYYRYYAQTNSYLGTSSSDLNVYYLGAQSGPGVANVGATSSWLPLAGCGTASSPADSWTFDATVFSTYEPGFYFEGAQGALADVTVLPLADGRYRMFIGGVPVTPETPSGIHSAISSDGVRFTLESGPRIPVPYPNPVTSVPGPATFMFAGPHVVRMDDGRVRLFVSGGGGISSLTTSDDGVTFTLDSGLRIRAADVGDATFAGASVVKMKTGGWRMYFSESNTGSVVDTTTGIMTLRTNRTFSAFSTDLLTWIIDPGVRAGPGSAIVNSVTAPHAASIANDDGSVTLIYMNDVTRTLYASTSTDGLNFTREVATPFSVGSIPGSSLRAWSTIGPGNDAFLMRLNTGEVRMYYDWGNDAGGAIYTARHPPFSATTSP